MSETTNNEALKPEEIKVEKPKKPQVKQEETPVVIPRHGAFRG